MVALLSTALRQPQQLMPEITQSVIWSSVEPAMSKVDTVALHWMNSTCMITPSQRVSPRKFTGIIFQNRALNSKIIPRGICFLNNVWDICSIRLLHQQLPRYAPEQSEPSTVWTWILATTFITIPVIILMGFLRHSQCYLHPQKIDLSFNPIFGG